MTSLSPTPTLTTSRLVLRPFTLADADPLFCIMNVPTMMQYFPNPNPPTPDRVERMIARQLEQWQTIGYGWWALALPATGALLGWCGLQFLPETGETEVGYLLARTHWGQGLATEAARASVDYGFTTFEFAEIIGITHPQNRASQRVLEKIGMTFTAATRYFEMECCRYAVDQATWLGSNSATKPAITKP